MLSPDGWLPAAFTALALAHFVALLSPGPDFFLIAGHAVRHQLRGSCFICLGVALGNGLYIALAMLGWSGLRDNPLLYTVVQWPGAGYLLWIGSRLLRSQPGSARRGSATDTPASATRQVLLGLGSALLNPKNALFYMSLMAVILGAKVTLFQPLLCGAWMVLVVLVWDLLVAALIGRPAVRQRLNRRLHLIERGAGAVLLSFGMGLLLQADPGD